MSEWQLIETAPTDGTRILGWVKPDQWSPNGYAYVVRWEHYQRPGDDGQMGAWTEAAGEGYATFRLSHWRPLPEPPLAPDTASAD